jgi:hypothetical protein
MEESLLRGRVHYGRGRACLDERLHVGVGLLRVPLRNPAALAAMEIATVTRMFPGGSDEASASASTWGGCIGLRATLTMRRPDRASAGCIRPAAFGDFSATAWYTSSWRSDERRGRRSGRAGSHRTCLSRHPRSAIMGGRTRPVPVYRSGAPFSSLVSEGYRARRATTPPSTTQPTRSRRHADPSQTRSEFCYPSSSRHDQSFVFNIHPDRSERSG